MRHLASAQYWDRLVETQDVLFWRLAGRSAPTGLGIVHWIGCIKAIKVTFSPSTAFITKNQLASEGPLAIQPVVIPALKPTLDPSLVQDKSLCPVRALRYYLDKTKDLGKGKKLLFVAIKEGYSKDISKATISSWIKQSIILAYQKSDQEVQNVSGT